MQKCLEPRQKLIRIFVEIVGHEFSTIQAFGNY
jgi:hypothetical protein